jgi:UDP-N-acetylmuramoyl-tripeptide--D-alanyl-D-alanine ligase
MALGDMRELGVESPALHAALAKDLIEAKIDRVYCCGQMMKLLYEELPPEMQGFQAPDSTTLAQHLAAELRPGDIVTVKGSNAINMRLVVDAVKALSTKKQKMAS